MKLQGRRLSNGTQGDDVRLLHRELLLLGFHLIPEDETHPGIFGPHTLVAVREFQQRAGLPVTGVVDEATAHAINEQVAGTPAQATAPAKPGSANSKDGSDQKPKDGPDQKPTDGSDKPNVQAVDRDLRHEQPLGSVVVKDGRYEIRYHRSQFVKAEKDSADLVMKILGSEGEEKYRTPIHYNVPDEVEINISLQGGEYQGPSEWEVLTSTFTPLLDDVAPQDLREDDQYQDISFLAGETGASPLLIGTWIASFRLNAKTTREQTPLAPEVFYGFLRQGEPSIFHDSLLDDLQHPDRVTLIGDKLLRALAEILPDRQRALLEKAIADNLIPARIKVQLQNVLDTLHRIKLRYAADVNLGGGKGTIGQLLEITPIAKQQQAAFLTAFTAHTGPLKDFWQKLEDDKVLPHDAVQQVKLSFELG
ncbi:MAG: peptidoglycan-binding protein, partial [Burkholderia sp.]|nr:peptidoglycan-binding protein [Burkholderia sp.]